ncbi:hypothetical protein HK102_005498 [Quaeritorhiza haematococci]|nr:hypothetical protein HK102_005498 [Quaeritorhiza haematococci]
MQPKDLPLTPDHLQPQQQQQQQQPQPQLQPPPLPEKKNDDLLLSQTALHHLEVDIPTDHKLTKSDDNHLNDDQLPKPIKKLALPIAIWTSTPLVPVIVAMIWGTYLELVPTDLSGLSYSVRSQGFTVALMAWLINSTLACFVNLNFLYSTIPLPTLVATMGLLSPLETARSWIAYKNVHWKKKWFPTLLAVIFGALPLLAGFTNTRIKHPKARITFIEAYLPGESSVSLALAMGVGLITRDQKLTQPFPAKTNIFTDSEFNPRGNFTVKMDTYRSYSGNPSWCGNLESASYIDPIAGSQLNGLILFEGSRRIDDNTVMPGLPPSLMTVAGFAGASETQLCSRIALRDRASGNWFGFALTLNLNLKEGKSELKLKVLADRWMTGMCSFLVRGAVDRTSNMSYSTFLRQSLPALEANSVTIENGILTMTTQPFSLAVDDVIDPRNATRPTELYWILTASAFLTVLVWVVVMVRVGAMGLSYLTGAGRTMLLGRLLDERGLVHEVTGSLSPRLWDLNARLKYVSSYEAKGAEWSGSAVAEGGVGVGRIELGALTGGDGPDRAESGDVMSSETTSNPLSNEIAKLKAQADENSEVQPYYNITVNWVTQTLAASTARTASDLHFSARPSQLGFNVGVVFQLIEQIRFVVFIRGWATRVISKQYQQNNPKDSQQTHEAHQDEPQVDESQLQVQSSLHQETHCDISLSRTLSPHLWSHHIEGQMIPFAPSTQQPPNLPAEIVRDILLYIAADELYPALEDPELTPHPTTLTTCTLVNKTWSAVATQLLWKRIKLSDISSQYPFYFLLLPRSEDLGVLKNAASPLATLDPTIHLQDLEIYCGDVDHVWKLLLQRLSIFANLQSLTLKGIESFSLESVLFDQCLPSLQELVIIGRDDDEHAWNWKCAAPSYNRTKARAFFSRLESIEYPDCRMDDGARECPRLVDSAHENLRSIYFTKYTPDAIIARFFAKCSNTLTVVRIQGTQDLRARLDDARD